MADITHNENALAKTPSGEPAKKSGMSTFDKIVIAVLVLGFAAVAAYQIFFCGTCYVGGGRVVG